MSGDAEGVPSRDVIAAWSPRQRDEIARILGELAEGPGMRVNRRRRLVVLLITCFGAVGLIPWIVYLNTTLPSTSPGGAWRTAWVGYDIGLAGVLGCAGWMALHRRQLVMLLLPVAAALIAVDAWFDITLSWGTSEHMTWIVTAGALELPVAGFLIIVDWLLLKQVVRIVAALRGRRSPSFSLWRAPIVMLGSPGPTGRTPGLRTGCGLRPHRLMPHYQGDRTLLPRSALVPGSGHADLREPVASGARRRKQQSGFSRRPSRARRSPSRSAGR